MAHLLVDASEVPTDLIEAEQTGGPAAQQHATLATGR